MNELELRKYQEFMGNPANSHNCDKCPENEGFSSGRRIPCGQFNCWVDCHCHHDDEDKPV